MHCIRLEVGYDGDDDGDGGSKKECTFHHCMLTSFHKMFLFQRGDFIMRVQKALYNTVRRSRDRGIFCVEITKLTMHEERICDQVS